MPPLHQNTLGPVWKKRITKFCSSIGDTRCFFMSGSPVMSNWMQMSLVRNSRNSEEKMGAAVIGLCAWKQE